MTRKLRTICVLAVTGLFGGVAFAQNMSVRPDETVEFSFGGFEGGPFVPGTATVWTLEGTDIAPADFTVISDQAWLLVAPTSGHLPGSAVLDRTRDVNATIDTVEASKLAPGVYTANVSFTNITSGEGTTSRSVQLTVAAANFSISPGFVTVSATQNGPNPGPVTLLLQGNGQADLNYTVDWMARPWFTVNKTSGTVHGATTDSLVVSFNTLGQSAGTYTGTINIENTTNGIGSRQVPVSLVVQQGGTGSVVLGPDQDLEVVGAAGQIPENVQQSTLVNNSDAVVIWTASASENWVSVTPSGGQLAATNHSTGGLDEQTVTIRVNSAVDDLDPGSHTATVTFQNVTAGGGSGATNIGTRIVHIIADPVLHISVPLTGGSVTAAPPTQVVAGGSSSDLIANFGDVVTVTVKLNDGFAFSGWGADFHLDNNLENPLVLTMDKNRTVSAVIVPIDQKLTLSTSGSGTGTVKVTPSGSSIDNDLVSSYPRGTQVTITAVADDGSVFRGWAGNVPQGSDQTNPLTVVVDTDRTITARFDPLVELTIQSSSGGTVTVDPDQTSFAPGSTVTLTATPTEGFVFTGWGGAGSGTSSTLTLTLSSSETVTAAFAPDTGSGGGNGGGDTSPRLVVDVQGSGTVTPDGGTFADGQTVTLIATPSITSTFVRWEGDASGTDLVTTVVMNGDRQVQAVFATADTGGSGRPVPGLPNACGAMGAIGLPMILLGLASMMMFRGRHGL